MKKDQSFFEAKVLELEQANKAVRNQLNRASFTIKEMKELKDWGTSLGNYLLQAYLKVGILVEESTPEGKSSKEKYYRFVSSRINEVDIKRAYNIKDELNSKNHPKIFSRIVEIKSPETTNKIKEEIKENIDLIPATPKQEITETFPTPEDCISYLKHYYGMNVVVIPVPEGYTIANWNTIKE